MSYQHMFYGVDIDRLRSIYGSGDTKLVADVLRTQVEELENNDAFFDVQIEDGTCPNSETALRDIIAGSAKQDKEAAAMYGYVLKMICEHVGSSIGVDVAAVRDHPFDSQLVASGPPIPIPYDRSDGPQIGYLAFSDIPDEIKRIDSAPRRAKRSLLLTIVSLVSRGMIGRQMTVEETVEDMQAYRETLQQALDKGVSIVSFRH